MATPAEQAELRRAVELVDAALTVPPAERRRALQRAMRAVDRIVDPGNLSALSGRELLDAIAERFPAETPTAQVGIHQKTDYGVTELIDRDG